MKGYSLHVGVGFVDEDRYNSNKMFMFGPEKDASDMYDLTQATKLFDPKNSHKLINEKATSVNFFSKMDEIARATENDFSGAYVFISFSCHGASLKDSKDDSKAYIQLLCFYDRMILEQEIRGALSKFSNHVKCFIVLDACYSGGLPPQPRIIPFSQIDKGKNLEHTEYIPKDKFLNLAETNTILSTEENKEMYDYLFLKHLGIRHTIVCDLCFLAACAKNGTTKEGSSINSNSAFTRLLLINWQNGSFDGNYKKLYNDLILSITHEKGPRISGHKSPFFIKTKPFIYNQKL